MNSFTAASHVRSYYPDAIKAKLFVKSFLWFMRHALSIGEDHIAFLTSVCSDDLNSVELPDTKMIGPFILGGLDGYPFVGKTGLGAFSHHIPERGAALLFFGPHVGITDAGEVGMVVRPGQSHASACCGAAMAGLKKLAAGGISAKSPCDFAVDDYQQETLEQLLLTNSQEILGTGQPNDPERFVRLTEVVYRSMRTSMTNLLKNIVFEAPAFVFGGILINEDGGKESSIELRTAYRLDRGRLEDVTDAFKQQTAERFRELQSGKLNAFE